MKNPKDKKYIPERKHFSAATIYIKGKYENVSSRVILREPGFY